MFTFEMLPARQGDCLWISYGPSRSPHHLVIDGGPEKARVLLSQVEHELKQADNGSLHIDLLVVTHVDNDHIGGVLELFENFPDGLTIGDVWFNAYRHLLPPDKLGPAQGERLSKALKKLVARSKLSWNQAFDGGPVVIAEQGELPVRKRHDGLKLTLLRSDPAQLAKLAKVWKTVVEEEMRPKKDEEEGAADRLGRKDEWPPDLVKLAKARFQQDTGEANGSSIAFLVEYDGTRVLCTGDAFPSRILEPLDRFEGDGRLKLAAYKLSHHGSKKSNNSDLLNKVSCERYLVSTNGSYFGHPDAEAMARVLMHGGKKPTLIFNSV